MAPVPDHWTLDKRVPLAIIFALIVQSTGIVWWGASLNERVAQLEAEHDDAKGQDGRIIRVETRLDGIAAALDKINDKLDRMASPRLSVVP